MNWMGVGNNNIFGVGGGYPYQGGGQGGGYSGGYGGSPALREYPKVDAGMNAGAQSQPAPNFNTWGAPTTYNPYTGYNNTGFNPNIFGSGTPPPDYFNNTTPWWQQQQQQQQPTAPMTQPAAVNNGENDGNIMGTDGWNTPKLSANQERHRDYTDAFREYKKEEGNKYATWSDYDRARGLLSSEGLGKLGVSDEWLDRMAASYTGLPPDMFEPNWQGNEFTKLAGQVSDMFFDKFETNYPEEIQGAIDDYMGKENWTVQDGIKSLFSGGTQAPAPAIVNGVPTKKEVQRLINNNINARSDYALINKAKAQSQTPTPVVRAPAPVDDGYAHTPQERYTPPAPKRSAPVYHTIKNRGGR